MVSSLWLAIALAAPALALVVDVDYTYTPQTRSTVYSTGALSDCDPARKWFVEEQYFSCSSLTGTAFPAQHASSDFPGYTSWGLAGAQSHTFTVAGRNSASEGKVGFKCYSTDGGTIVSGVLSTGPSCVTSPALTCDAGMYEITNCTDHKATVRLEAFLSHHADTWSWTSTLGSLSNANSEAPLLTVLPTAGGSLCDQQVDVDLDVTGLNGQEESCSATIRIVDSQAPVFRWGTSDQLAPESQTAECTDIPSAIAPLATDNCQGLIEVNFVESLTQTTQGKTITRHWSAADSCLHEVSHTQILTVVDSTEPELIGVPDHEFILFSEFALNGEPCQVTALDDCDGQRAVTYLESRKTGGCPRNFTVTRSWAASDSSGNDVLDTQTITVYDNEAPIFNVNFPDGAQTVECSDVPMAPLVYAFDDGEPVDVDFSEERNTADPASPNEYTIIRSWFAQDECGNSASTSQTIVVVDTEAPQWIPVDADCEPETLDNCDTNVTVVCVTSVTTGSCVYNYTLTEVCTATDAAGNVNSTTTVEYFDDNTPPEFKERITASLTLQCKDAAQIPILTCEDRPTTDIVDSDLQIFYSESKVPGDTCNHYTLNREWSCLDLCGNSVTKNQVVNVIDTVAPEFDGFPDHVTVHCTSVPDAATTVVVTDTCGGNLALSTPEDKLVGYDGSCDNYNIERTWVGYDCAQNNVSQTQTITVQDTAGPTINMTSLGGDDKTTRTPCTSDGDLSVVDAGIRDDITASDDCGSVSPVVSRTETPTECGHVSNYTYTWSATDSCGKSIGATHLLEVYDDVSPTLTGVPADDTQECNATITAPTVTASDTCEGALSVQFSELEVSTGACRSEIRRDWYAADCAGNPVSGDQTVTVVDTVVAKLVNLPAATLTFAHSNAVPDISEYNVQVEDNCQNLNVVFSEVKDDGDCDEKYTLTRTWSVEDPCFPQADIRFEQVITVWDDVKCNATVPADETYECAGANLPAEAYALNPPTVLHDVPSGNCFSNESTSTCGSDCEKMLYNTWVTYDDCENVKTLTQTVTIKDTTPPTISGVPAHATAECKNEPAVPTGVTADDTCLGPLTPTPDLVQNVVISGNETTGNYVRKRVWQVSDGCNPPVQETQLIEVKDTTPPAFVTKPPEFTSHFCETPSFQEPTYLEECSSISKVVSDETVPGPCDKNYTRTRTWYIEDDSGLFDTYSATITVYDNAAPVWDQVSLPQDITVHCDPGQPAVLTAQDDCGGKKAVAVHYSDVSTYDPDTQCDNYELTRTWLAEDDCGNKLTHTQVVTVRDATPPTLTVGGETTNKDETVACGDPIPEVPTTPGYVSYNDNCGYATVAFSEEVGPLCSLTGQRTTRTWTATDACGQQTTVRHVYRSPHVFAPVWCASSPGNQSLECEDPGPFVPFTAVTSKCQLELSVTCSETRTNGSLPDEYELLRACVATDECGSDASHVQLIKVNDTCPPEIPPPPPVTVPCYETPYALPTPNISSEPDVNVTFIGEVNMQTTCADGYTYENKWIVQDANGNTQVILQLVTVEDREDPYFTSEPVDVTQQCQASPGEPVAADKCTTTVTVGDAQKSNVSWTSKHQYVKKFDWTATDDCGLTATADQTITVVDDEEPVISTSATDLTVGWGELPPCVTVVFTDNCEGTVSYVGSNSSTGGPCIQSKYTTCSYDSCDSANNCEHFNYTYYEIDTENPYFEKEPADVTVEVAEIPPTPSGDDTVKAKDNQDEFVHTVFRQRTNRSLEGTTILITPVVGDPYNATVLYQIIREWNATDNCGNNNGIDQTITVIDTVAPNCTGIPAATALKCNELPTKAEWDQEMEDIALAIENANDHPNTTTTVTHSWKVSNKTVGTCKGTYTLTRTWVATDSAGNECTGSQQIDITDETKPTFDHHPLCGTVYCELDPAPVLIATDECANSTWVEEGTGGAAGEVEVLFSETVGDGKAVQLWSATDGCNDASTWTRTVYITDAQDPTWTTDPLPSHKTVTCSIPPPDTLGAEDNCSSATPDVSNVTDMNCPNAGSIVYTWKAMDNANNFITHTQTVTITDNAAPVISFEDTLVEQITAECKAPAPQNATALDNCAGAVTAGRSYADTPIGDVPGAGDFNFDRVYTWTATDNCQQSDTKKQTVQVRDTEYPWFTNPPADTTYECAAPATLPLPGGEDACDQNPQVLVSVVDETTDPCQPVTVRYFSVSDSTGLTTYYNQTITLHDTTPPQCTGIPSATKMSVNCDQIPPVAPWDCTDSCNLLSQSFSEDIGSPEDPGMDYPYTITRTWAWSDCSGDHSHKLQIVVTDENDPVVTPPAGGDLTCNQPPNTTITFTDVCDSDPRIVHTDSKTLGDCDSHYTLTRTWEVFDSSGGSVEASATWNGIKDNTKPTFILPGDFAESVTVACGDTPAVELNSTDDCDGFLGSAKLVTEYKTYLDPAHGVYGLYDLHRSWVAQDQCGNKQAQNQTVHVLDTVTPIFVRKENDTNLFCFEDIPSPVPGYVSDGKDTACNSSMTVTTANQTSDQLCLNNYTFTRTYTVTDQSGKSSSYEQKFVIVDPGAPVFNGTEPADQTVECGQIPPRAYFSVTDDCNKNIDVVYKEVRVPEDATCAPYDLVRTWTADDLCNHVAEYRQTIRVRDNTPPTINRPGHQTIECGATSFPGAIVTATDNCSPDTFTLNVTESVTETNCRQKELVRYWEYSDCSDNTASYTQTILSIDTQAPQLSFGGFVFADHVSAECHTIPDPPTATATDCNSFSTAFSAAIEDRDDEDDNDYTIVWLWTASDECGNTAYYRHEVAVYDTESPTLSEGETNRTEYCTLTPKSDPTVNDTCDGTPDLTFSETNVPAGCEQNYTRIRTWHAEDASGNVGEYSATVEVYDNLPPVLNGLNGDSSTTVECDAVPTPPPVTVSDCDATVTHSFSRSSTQDEDADYNYVVTDMWYAKDDCDNVQTVTHVITVVDTTPPVLGNLPAPSTSVPSTDVPGPSTDVNATDNCAPVYPSLTTVHIPGPCDNNYTIIHTWITTDSNGLTDRYEQTVHVTDTEAPSLDGVPADITVEQANIPLMTTDGVTATDTDGVSYPVRVTESRSTVGNEEFIIRTFSAVDGCGNGVEEEQTITVIDTTPCIFSEILSNETVECDAVPSACAMYCVGEEGTVIPVLSEHQEMIDGYLHNLVRVWSAEDASGNVAQLSQTITLEDNTPPQLTREPGHITVECDCDTFPAVPAVFALDNCDTNAQVLFTEVETTKDSEDHYTLVRSWSASDAEGNSVSHTQTVTVQDNLAPVIGLTPQELEVSCEDRPAPATNWVTDNCDPNVQLEFSESEFDQVCDHEYKILRTWAATDRSGRHANHTQTIRVSDEYAPTVSKHARTTCIKHVEDKYYQIPLANDAAYWGITDNCADASDITVSLKYCNTTQPHLEDADHAWFPSCSLSAAGTLSLLADRMDRSSIITVGREYSITGEATDKCSRTVSFTHKFYIPLDATDAAVFDTCEVPGFSSAA